MLPDWSRLPSQCRVSSLGEATSRYCRPRQAAGGRAADDAQNGWVWEWGWGTDRGVVFLFGLALFLWMGALSCTYAYGPHSTSTGRLEIVVSWRGDGFEHCS